MKFIDEFNPLSYGNAKIDEKFSKIPRGYEDRLEYIRQLSAQKETSLDLLDEALTPENTKYNIENFIGAIQVPLGVAGPLLIKGQKANGLYHVPMATTEGALLASYSRGMKMISLAGGAETFVYDDYFLRAAMLVTSSLKKGQDLLHWCDLHRAELEEMVASCSRFIKLKELSFQFIGKDLLVSLALGTGDAMGSNMGSKAASVVAQFIKEKSGLVDKIYFPLPEDKKFIPKRQKGKKVVARVTLTQEIISSLGHTTIQDMIEYTRFYKDVLAYNASYSLNIHAANGMTALFLAFGQDPAYIGECSQVLTRFYSEKEGELECSVTIPSLIIGSVGGGTGLPSSKFCLDLVGCRGRDQSVKLAEIMAATILAGEINCCAAQCANDFISAHEEMGKNRPNYTNRN